MDEELTRIYVDAANELTITRSLLLLVTSHWPEISHFDYD